MRTLRLVAAALVIVLLVSWLSVVLYPSVKDFMEANPGWNGLSDFLGEFGAELVTGVDQAELRPEGSVLIAIPYLPYDEGELRRIERFVHDGGTLLLMDDYGYGNQVLQALGLQMQFAGLPMLDPYVTYRNQWFPLVTDLAPSLGQPRMQYAMLNYATALIVLGPYDILASSSPTSFLDNNGDADWNRAEPRGPFVVAARATLGSGMVIAVSDPSLIINSMVNRADNKAFLQQLISLAGENPYVVVDDSHLPQAPLDILKYSWQGVRARVAVPYSQVLLVGIILVLTLMPVWRKGNEVGPR
ncbi:MAG: DUF4350 domain-containing protein [Planctomycetota bacterium]